MVFMLSDCCIYAAHKRKKKHVLSSDSVDAFLIFDEKIELY